MVHVSWGLRFAGGDDFRKTVAARTEIDNNNNVMIIIIDIVTTLVLSYS